MIQEISPKFLYHKKRSAMDAHSCDRNMLPSATALGASMLQATCFLVPEKQLFDCKKILYNREWFYET
ncbi:hypothetical protein CSX02_10570 [Agathobacter ruminis]|uniref:Uncharacterized protein n=1 Tax=Agathobacter ruminis TaxID=1712665 RepID=A0A2G3E0W8_9FIRM|nr:hypothetical protein CSX02_10570 [Agathobacter ruminis]